MADLNEETNTQQIGEPGFTQGEIDKFLKLDRKKGQEEKIGHEEKKFSYEQKLFENGWKPEYRLVRVIVNSKPEIKDDLFIGKSLENGSSCVIRRYNTKNHSDAKNYLRDLEALQTNKILHENFIRYFGKVEIGDYAYYAVELCRYSVEELIRNENTETLYARVWETLTREKIMHQTTLGLDYLHGLEGKPIHRNIHGRNVLVAEISSSTDTHYVVKLSDFRFGKSVLKEGDQQSNTQSPSNWTAPEIENSGTVGPWTDVFILGCFFYYVLSGGHHPFDPNKKTNIQNSQYKPTWNQHKAGDQKMVDNYLELMERMTRFDAPRRPTTGQILRHFDTKEYYPIYLNIDHPGSATATRPGLCVIFHQDNFVHPKFPNLIGYREDVKSLCKTFWLFGYDLRIYVDLTAQELLETVKNLANEGDSNGSIFRGYASLVVCILSHGDPGTVAGIDGESVHVSKLQWAFSRKKCPDLQDKAKIFFIQACQGHKNQNETNTPTVADAANVRLTGPLINSPENTNLNVNVINNTAMMKAPFSDVVTMWATIVDYASYVHPDNGSSFIQSLYYHLVHSQGGTRITGGDRIRDLHDAHLAITQQVSSKPIYASVWFKTSSGEFEQRLMNVNQTPFYTSTACGKKVGFQVVGQHQRCKQINYYHTKDIVDGFKDNGVIHTKKDTTPVTYYVQLDATNKLDAKLCPMRKFPPIEPMEIDHSE